MALGAGGKCKPLHAQIKEFGVVTEVDVVVIGAGPAGLTAAITLAAAGVATTFVAGRVRPVDNRTTALLASSVTALDAIGVWPRCRPNAAPLRTLRIVDDTKRLWRAPEVEFASAEIGSYAFGWNIENRHLMSALAERARELANLTWLDANARSLDIDARRVAVLLDDDRSILARLVIGADGRNSMCRTAAGIRTQIRDYPQTALTLNVHHSRPHVDTCVEFHTETGPFTVVPLPGHRSSVVAVLAPADAADLARADAETLARTVEQRMHSVLGKITIEPGLGVFPLTVQTAHRMAANRVALVGEAGHVIPPIGAQGLNLGLRDAATIGELASDALTSGADIGGAHLTDRYADLRRADVSSRTLLVDVLNRSLLSDLLPLQGARGLSLYALSRIGPLRRAVMREGANPAAFQPGLMRREGPRFSP